MPPLRLVNSIVSTVWQPTISDAGLAWILTLQIANFLFKDSSEVVSIIKPNFMLRKSCFRLSISNDIFFLQIMLLHNMPRNSFYDNSWLHCKVPKQWCDHKNQHVFISQACLDTPFNLLTIHTEVARSLLSFRSSDNCLIIQFIRQESHEFEC